MDRQVVTSSSIASVGYDETTATLEIEFVKGHIYQYYGVPSHEHEALLQAPSIGSYFLQHIRNAGYDYAKIS